MTSPPTLTESLTFADLAAATYADIGPAIASLPAGASQKDVNDKAKLAILAYNINPRAIERWR
ncbi:MAG: hypothetical protein HYW28_05360 [Rhodospirillales bacterium]|nr:hypothetical protein [Rhodospirillales bacterium]